VFWVAACTPPADNAASPNPAPGSTATAASTSGGSGADIFGRHCKGCHGDQGQGASGPALAAEAKKPEADLRSVIENGDGKMPSFKGKLTDEQITAVVQHVKSLGGG
jgi:mono/diheme cytochrome c family protein